MVGYDRDRLGSVVDITVLLVRLIFFFALSTYPTAVSFSVAFEETYSAPYAESSGLSRATRYVRTFSHDYSDVFVAAIENVYCGSISGRYL